MSIVLFAIIGATINAGTAYWICFSGFCVVKLIKYALAIIEAFKE